MKMPQSINIFAVDKGINSTCQPAVKVPRVRECYLVRMKVLCGRPTSVCEGMMCVCEGIACLCQATCVTANTIL